MVTPTSIIETFEKLIDQHGVRCRLRTFTVSYSGATYDDAYVTISGTDSWFNGLPQNISNSKGDSDYHFLEQGLIKPEDLKLYIPGSIAITDVFKYKLFVGGSPSITTPYEVIEQGVVNWELSGTDVYKKVYLKLLQGGSFVHEY